MFKYEDMDYQSLSTSLDIENPDGPDELYALAQFCRMGKGIDASDENYRLYLQRAAKAGSEQAKEELATLNFENPAQSKPSTESKPVKNMSLAELLQAADNGDPQALLPLAQKALTDEYLDLPKAKMWLEKAAKFVPHGIFSDEDSVKIYLLLAHLLQDPTFDSEENRVASHTYYGLAAELGSGEAYDELADQYETGYGCAVDLEKAELYRKRGAENNDPAILCSRAHDLVDEENASRLEIMELLNRARGLTHDKEVLGTADLIAMAGGLEDPKPDVLEWAWGLEKDGEIEISLPLTSDPQDAEFLSVSDMMVRIYGTDPTEAIHRNLPLNPERAALLACWQPSLKDSAAFAQYSAEHGNFIGMYCYGKCLLRGAGTDKDTQKGFSYCLQAAQNGFVPAQAEVSECYRTSNGVTANIEQCKFWGEKAAAAGNADALCTLGRLYLYQNSVQDYEKAKSYLEQASEKGSAIAFTELGGIYNNGYGVAQDPQRAFTYYKQGADKGNSNAQAYIGYFYDQGRGVSQDYKKAFDFYTLAAEQGNVMAQNNLGVLYGSGRGVAQNRAKACELYQKAADGGDSVAMTNLACAYADGSGVPKDDAKAFTLFKKAEALGRILYMRLSNCYLYGRGVAKDYDKAISYIIANLEKGGASKEATAKNLLSAASFIEKDNGSYNLTSVYAKAAEFGSTEAMMVLARNYEQGKGVAQDKEMARKYYEDAARANNEEAIQWLLHDGKSPSPAPSEASYTDPLLKRADEILKQHISTEERSKVKLQLSLRENDAEASALLKALDNQDSAAEEIYHSALVHRENQRAAAEAGNMPLVRMENDQTKELLQQAAAQGSVKAANELEGIEKAENGLHEAEKLLGNSSDPITRIRIEDLLQIAAANFVPEAQTLLAPMLKQDHTAKEKLDLAMNLIKTGKEEDRKNAIDLLNESFSLGNKAAGDALATLKEDYIRSKTLLAGDNAISRERAILLWDSLYGTKAQNPTDLLIKADDMLKKPCSADERHQVMLQLEILKDNAQAQGLLDAMRKQDEATDKAVAEARSILRKVSAVPNKKTSISDRENALKQLEMAASHGNADAEEELKRQNQADAIVRETEKLMLNRKDPDVRAEIQQRLEPLAENGHPKAVELLSILQKETAEAEKRYREAMNLLNTGSDDDRRMAEKLLHQNQIAGHKDSCDVLQRLEAERKGNTQIHSSGTTHTNYQKVLNYADSPRQTKSRSDDSPLLSYEREALGEKLAGGALLWLVSTLICIFFSGIPVIGTILYVIFNLVGFVASIVALYAAYKIGLVHHISFNDPDIVSGYKKAPMLLMDFFNKKN